MDDGMDEIVREFLVESHENLDQIDVDLVALEKDPTSRDRLARVFRAIHTIKGTSGFLDLPVLEHVAHAGETLLASLRDGDLVLTTERATLLLATVDAVREILRSVEAGNGEGPLHFGELVAMLEHAVRDEPAPAAQPGPAAAAATPEPAAAAPTAAAVQPEPAAPATPVAEPTPAPAAATAVEQPTASMPALLGDTPAEEEREAGTRRGPSESSVRVDVGVLDSLMRLVGELVLTRNQLSAHSGAQGAQDGATRTPPSSSSAARSTS